MSLYAAIDLHSSNSVLAVMDGKAARRHDVRSHARLRLITLTVAGRKRCLASSQQP
jgi:hypothetical protein